MKTLHEHAHLAAGNGEVFTAQGLQIPGDFVTNLRLHGIQQLEDGVSTIHRDGVSTFSRIRENDRALHAAPSTKRMERLRCRRRSRPMGAKKGADMAHGKRNFVW